MITEKDILRMATLSKLEIAEKDVPFYIKEIEYILGFAEAVDGASGESGFSEPQPVDYNTLRADEVLPSTESREILLNAKDTEDGFIKLRKRG